MCGRRVSQKLLLGNDELGSFRPVHEEIQSYAVAQTSILIELEPSFDGMIPNALARVSIAVKNCDYHLNRKSSQIGTSSPLLSFSNVTIVTRF